jgi:MoxR-like ATPase
MAKKKKEDQKVDVAKLLSEWVERDLTADAEEGRLNPAFEIDDLVQQLAEVIASKRHPIVAGEAGVGKSAVVQELVRRGTTFEGRRVLQISIRNRVSGLLKPDQIRPEMQKLVAALIALGDRVVPYIRDIDLAYSLDLEPQLVLLALRFPGTILAEGDARGIETLLEQSPDLEPHFLMLKVPEPDLPTTRRIVDQWAKHRGSSFEPDALATALELSHRFLARSRMPRKVLDFLGQVKSVVPSERKVDRYDVIDRFHVAYKIPRLLIDPRLPFDPIATEREFCAKVLEQTEAVSAVVRMVSLIKSGLSDTRRPFGAFLFVGPTGVGKTHIAQLLAEYLFGSRDRLVRLNMADFSGEDDAFTLFGRPGSYVMRQRRGELTMRLLGHPFAVLLLDEFEKAHVKVHDRFLQLIDEGVFINGAGETVSCRSSILIATSNAGAEVYRGPGIGFSPHGDLSAQDRELDRRLLEHFRLEFLNRFDQIVHFHPLSRAGIRSIALREVEALRHRSGVESSKVTLEIDDGVLDWLAAHGYDPHYGARFLRRAIERHVTTALAEVMVTEAPGPGSHVELGVRGGRIRARVRAVEAEPDRRETVRLPQGPAERVRALDRTGLLAEARDLLDRARGRKDALAARREEARALLQQMNAPDFWNDALTARRVLDQYRELDVANQIEARFAGALERLEDLQRSDAQSKLLASAVEQAARALADWERRMAEQGPSAAWLVVRNVDPLNPDDEFLRQIVDLELSWCRRLHLGTELVAFGETDGRIVRAAIEVEGPGTLSYLEMEHGVHRLSKTGAADSRVQIDVLSRKSPNGKPAQVFALRKRKSGLGLDAGFVGRIERDATLVELFGREREALSRLLSELMVAPLASLGELPAARLYVHEGAGARDPRTKAVIPRFKDVLGGRLDPMLDAWQRREQLGA